MTKLVINIEDGSSDSFEIKSLDSVGAAIKAEDLDGGSVVLMAADRSIAVNSSIKLEKAGKAESKPEPKTTKKPTKKTTKKKVAKK